MKLRIKKLADGARLPVYATEGAACLDLSSIDSMVVGAGAAHTFRTGLAVEVPVGHVMLVFSRSGHGFKHGVRLANCVGVIDSDYRGELMVRLANDGLLPLKIEAGDRIAQAMILPVPGISQIEVIDELSSTARGEGGFGSTGHA